MKGGEKKVMKFTCGKSAVTVTERQKVASGLLGQFQSFKATDLEEKATFQVLQFQINRRER